MRHIRIARFGLARLVLACVTVLTLAVLAPSGATLAAGHTPATAFSVPPGWPQTLIIPRITVHAPLESVALTSPRDVHAPFRWSDAGWYSRGARPGDMGRAVIFGHLDSTCCPAVFWSLGEVKPGDTIQMAYRSGKILTFRVVWQHVFANTDLPVRWMFGGGHQRGLVLFTCAGIFHHDGTGYDHKLVLFARAIMPNGGLG